MADYLFGDSEPESTATARSLRSEKGLHHLLDCSARDPLPRIDDPELDAGRGPSDRQTNRLSRLARFERVDQNVHQHLPKKDRVASHEGNVPVLVIDDQRDSGLTKSMLNELDGLAREVARGDPFQAGRIASRQSQKAPDHALDMVGLRRDGI
jgi:hypothetical protein